MKVSRALCAWRGRVGVRMCVVAACGAVCLVAGVAPQFLHKRMKPFWFEMLGLSKKPPKTSLCERAPRRRVNTLRTLRELKLSPCRFAVVDELMHAGAVTRWVHLQPAMPPQQVAALQAQHLPPSTATATVAPTAECAVSGLRASMIPPPQAAMDASLWCAPTSCRGDGRPCFSRFVQLASWTAATARTFIALATDAGVAARRSREIAAAAARAAKDALSTPRSTDELEAECRASAVASPGPLGDRPLVVIHMRDMPQYMPIYSPCAEPDGPNLLQRLRELGLWGEDGQQLRLLVMHDRSKPSVTALKYLRHHVGADSMLALDSAFVDAVAQAVGVTSKSAALLTEMYVCGRVGSARARVCVAFVGVLAVCDGCDGCRLTLGVYRAAAIQADVFIGHRYSSLSCVGACSHADVHTADASRSCTGRRLWVSNARRLSGLESRTHSYCDDGPVSWLAPFPPPPDRQQAIDAGVRCQSITDEQSRTKATKQHGCRYQEHKLFELKKGADLAYTYRLPHPEEVACPA